MCLISRTTKEGICNPIKCLIPSYSDRIIGTTFSCMSCIVLLVAMCLWWRWKVGDGEVVTSCGLVWWRWWPWWWVVVVAEVVLVLVEHSPVDGCTLGFILKASHTITCYVYSRIMLVSTINKILKDTPRVTVQKLIYNRWKICIWSQLRTGT